MNDNDRATMRFNPEHAPGCPARYSDTGGDCDENAADVARRKLGEPAQVERVRMDATGLFMPVTIGDAGVYVLTARGLEALGFTALAALQRLDTRARLEARGLLDHEAGSDAPAGAGHDVEAERG